MIMKKVKIMICILFLVFTTNLQHVSAELEIGIRSFPVSVHWFDSFVDPETEHSRALGFLGGNEWLALWQIEDLYAKPESMALGTKSSILHDNYWLTDLTWSDGRPIGSIHMRQSCDIVTTEITSTRRRQEMWFHTYLSRDPSDPSTQQQITYYISAEYELQSDIWVKQAEAFSDNGVIGTFYLDTELSFAPIVNGNIPIPDSSILSGYTANIPTGVMLPITHQLEQNMTLSDLNENLTVMSGITNRTLIDTATAPVGTPQNELYVLTDLGGQPMNAGGLITGIGKTTWKHRVTDFDSDSTEFERDVTIQTEKKPNINLVYDNGDLAGTPFTDGTANGGIDGWSNVPLRVVVNSKNDDDSYVVDGYYFNQISDNNGGIAHGDNQKEPASKVYATETVGTSVTGVMVDDAKTTELSATTEPVSMKIDMTNPVAAVSYDLDTDTLINQSQDDLSGLRTTKVAIVPEGDPAPAEMAYRDFSEWQSFVNGYGQYDIYVTATDQAGNTATTTLINQLLRGGTTNLEISKTVVGKYGAYHRPFEVTVLLEDDQGMAVNGTYTVSSSLAEVNDYTVTFTGGKGVVYIKHGETITIKGVPVGYKYIVQETDEAVIAGDSLYSVTYNDTASANGITGVLEVSTAEVAIKNVRETIPDTGMEENQGILFMGSTLILLAFLVALNTYCSKKRSHK